MVCDEFILKVGRQYQQTKNTRDWAKWNDTTFLLVYEREVKALEYCLKLYCKVNKIALDLSYDFLKRQPNELETMQ